MAGTSFFSGQFYSGEFYFTEAAAFQYCWAADCNQIIGLMI